MPEYKLAVNDQNKATELPLCRVGGSVAQNPHMRAFWFATVSFFLAFLGWFALAPLGLEVAKSMEICENQLYPPANNPTRKAYLKFKNLKSEKFYCKYGRDDQDNPTDCNAGPLGNETDKYDSSVLTACVCTAGTHCKTTLGDAGTASVASTIFVRVALGTLLERFGPVNVQTCLMLFGAFWVALASTINAEWNFILIRFFIGMAGATFVTNQFWCSLMFAPNIVGTANATAAGWGNLGGGVTQFFMILVLFDPFVSAGMSENTAWRVAMLVPAGVFVLCGLSIKLLAWDTPTKKRFDPVADTGKRGGASLMDYVECLKDFRVVVMIFQYSACFGTELAMNNQLATHFRTYFQMKAADASLLASCFGGMNLFARSLGGITSDILFKYLGFRGRRFCWGSKWGPCAPPHYRAGMPMIIGAHIINSGAIGRAHSPPTKLRPSSASQGPRESTKGTGIMSYNGSKRSSKRSLQSKVLSSHGNGGTMRSTTTGSQKNSLADVDRTFACLDQQVEVDPPTLNSFNSGKPNRISTTKFTIASWLPMSLWFQFQRIANIYFLCVALIVLGLGDKSPKNWKSKVFPFMGVLLWTALKDAYEDLKRRRDDNEENCSKSMRYNSGTKTLTEVQWQNVKAGDLIFVAADEAFPADLLLLNACGGNEAFISTVNLDGESNLKEKRPVQLAAKMANPDPPTGDEGAVQFATTYVSKAVTLQLAAPEMSLAEVRGRMLVDGEECTATEVNFLPRGCVLRNTDWILGIAVYCGEESKTKLNAVKSTQKFSNMQVYLNLCVKGLLVFLMVLVLACTVMASLVQADDELWYIKFLRYVVTFYHVVPVSLYVIFEMLKLLLGWQVNTDKQMFDEATGKGAVARTADLMEELGQVDFLFSDKTGTLTANEMIFARCCIQGKDLGDFRPSSEQEGLRAVKRILAAPGDPQHDKVKLFFTILAVCNSVQVDKRDDGDTRRVSSTTIKQGLYHYSGMSPDEVALVQAAAESGLSFRRRTRDPSTGISTVTVGGPGAEDERSFQVLHELAFSSDRKRMSVLVRHNNELYCMTKGADNVMSGLITEPFDDSSADALQRFSKQGLRTLVVAFKRVIPDVYNNWLDELRSAEKIVDSTRNRRVAEVQAQIETDLNLVGLTAVEDRLQDGVPQAIQTIKDAGVKVWVLTGDKVETAVDIAMSCALFGPQTTLAYGIEADCSRASLAVLKGAREALSRTEDNGLVLDGKTIQYALEKDESKDLIYQLGLESRSCVCCRLSPIQKRQIVELVRAKNPTTITLAIGDGANDVPMLEGAHVGIGVRGKEGAQAVQVSDIAVSQFRFLVPILLCHGRRAYRRVALFLCYYLYKNVALVVSDIVWACQDEFRGRIAYPEYLSIGFNVLFTSWHILFVLGFDKGVPDWVANLHPELYIDGPKRALFNSRIFGIWMAYGAWHGVIVWIIPNLWFGGTNHTEGPSDFWMASCTSFLVTVLTVNFKLLLACLNPLALPATTTTAASFLLTVFALFMLGEVPLGYEMSGNEKMRGIPTQMFQDGKVWVCLLVVPLVALIPDTIEKIFRRMRNPTAMDKLATTKFTPDAPAN